MFKRAAPGVSGRQRFPTFDTRKCKPVNPAPDGRTGAAERSGDVTDTVTPVRHQHGGEPAGIIFIARFMLRFMQQTSFVAGYWCYDRPVGDFGWFGD